MCCPTCAHTMQNLGAPEKRIFWCPRCGTLKTFTGDFEAVELPSNLRRVVEMAMLSRARKGQTQHDSVECTYKVDQYDDERPRLELVIFRNGRRAF